MQFKKENLKFIIIFVYIEKFFVYDIINKSYRRIVKLKTILTTC